MPVGGDDGKIDIDAHSTHQTQMEKALGMVADTCLGTSSRFHGTNARCCKFPKWQFSIIYYSKHY